MIRVLDEEGHPGPFVQLRLDLSTERRQLGREGPSRMRDLLHRRLRRWRAGRACGRPVEYDCTNSKALF